MHVAHKKLNKPAKKSISNSSLMLRFIKKRLTAVLAKLKGINVYSIRTVVAPKDTSLLINQKKEPEAQL
jgi:hypothetical protein